MPDGQMRKRFPTKRSIAIFGVVLAMMLGATTVPSTASAAIVPLTNNPAKAAAGWLAREFTDQQRIELFFGGLPGEFTEETAESVLDFDAAGVAQDYARGATAWLASPGVLRRFLDGNGGSLPVIEAHALIILVAEAQGKNPRSFGGIDVVAELRAMLTPSGEFESPADGGGFGSQSIAIMALHRAGGVPRSAVSFLLERQCADGGFADPSSSIPPGPGQPSCLNSDPLSTPLPVEALLAVGGHRAAVNRALDWLETAQSPADGSFSVQGDAASLTGQAAVALAEGGRHAAAGRAVAFLKTLQSGCAGQPDGLGGLPERSGGEVGSGTSIEELGTIRATIASIPALARTDIGDASAHGARAKAPQLRCPATG
jgi:hypothetical protein